MAEKYGRLPTEIMRQEPGEFYLNLVVTFPEIVKKRKRREWREREEKKLGYNPIRKWIEQMRETLHGK